MSLLISRFFHSSRLWNAANASRKPIERCALLSKTTGYPYSKCQEALEKHENKEGEITRQAHVQADASGCWGKTVSFSRDRNIFDSQLSILSWQPTSGKITETSVAKNHQSLDRKFVSSTYSFSSETERTTANDAKSIIDLCSSTLEETLPRNVNSRYGRMPVIGRPFSQPMLQLQAAFTSTLLSPPYSALSSLTRPTPAFTEITRNVVKFSRLKGRRKTVAAIKNRFYRLDWGGWISAIPGRARHLWKKSPEHRAILKNHVLRKNTEVKLLEKFCTKYWIKKKYFVDDPYESYHTRDNFYITKGVKGINSTNLFKPPQYSCRQSKHRK